jgi:TRAP transporter TAXI family solute receptor
MRAFFAEHKRLCLSAALIFLLLIVFWLLSRYISPAPPKTLVFTAGSSDGAYYKFAQRYKTLLAKDGINLDVRESAGSVENLSRLRDSKNPAMAGFVQGGLGTISQGVDPDSDEFEALQSLAVLAYEPVWLFTRDAKITDIEQLKGRRIAIGAEGSGTRKVALDLLQKSGLAFDEKMWLPMGASQALKALADKSIDAVFVVAAPEAASVQQLLHAPHIYLMDIMRADALARLLPYLQTIHVPKGVLDIQNSIPANDVTMLSTTANLVVSDIIHPALAYLLLDAAAHVHSGGGALNRPGDFPQLKGADFPAAEEATRYFASGKPFLQRYMPFWAANFVQRLLLILIPLFAVIVPVVKLLPEIQKWRQERKLFKLYGELKIIELDIKSNGASPTIDDKLLKMEALIDKTTFAKIFTDRVYTLRQHVEFVRHSIHG